MHYQGPIGRALKSGALKLATIDLRQFGLGPHLQVDDTPFGGGAGMVLRVDVAAAAIGYARQQCPDAVVVLLSAKGQRLTQPLCTRLAQAPGLILLCPRFEGIDERIKHFCTLEISIGDFVLSSGDAAGVVLLDAVGRLRGEVMGNDRSLHEESFAMAGEQLLEYPHYTRPRHYQGLLVPEALCSGHHRAIAAWRWQQARRLTQLCRPDLLEL